MGPHGLLVGATGSGKSELLRTLVIGLAVTHSSRSSTSCWWTSRAAPRSPHWTACRTPAPSSPTSRTSCRSSTACSAPSPAS
ncbi:FtsK/SpoIIIE domain-containing protein [Luedemannella flava]